MKCWFAQRVFISTEHVGFGFANDEGREIGVMVTRGFVDIIAAREGANTDCPLETPGTYYFVRFKSARDGRPLALDTSREHYFTSYADGEAKIGSLIGHEYDVQSGRLMKRMLKAKRKKATKR